MRWTLGVPLAYSHAPVHSLSSSAEALPPSCCWASPANHLATPSHRRRRLVRTLPLSTHRLLHPVDSAPEGVPSSLLTFRQADTASTTADSDGDRMGDGGNGFVVGALQAGLVEDSDLGDVSALLVEVSVALVLHTSCGWVLRTSLRHRSLGVLMVRCSSSILFRLVTERSNADFGARRILLKHFRSVAFKMTKTDRVGSRKILVLIILNRRVCFFL